MSSSSLFNASRPSKTRRIWIPFTSRATDGSTLVLACSLTYNIGPPYTYNRILSCPKHGKQEDDSIDARRLPSIVVKWMHLRLAQRRRRMVQAS